MNQTIVAMMFCVTLTGCAAENAGRVSEANRVTGQTTAGGPLNVTRGSDSTATEFTAAHNRWRRAVGVSDIQWSEPIAQRSRKRAQILQQQGCPLVHDTDEFGENLFQAAANPGPPDASPTRAVDSWASELKDYTHPTNACRAGAVCGHYTQVVWSATQEFGCGSASCAKPDGWNETIWVCKYNPAGNVIGQRPY